jgi:beta-lactamase regulating signal transducer with metallopeptidase domain
LRRLPRVLAGDEVKTPAVVGVLRPALLLPTRVLHRFDPTELRLILMHELAHLKRHDVAGNWVLTLATIVHWFNPLVWLIAWRVRTDRELACDELVLARSRGQDAQTYGRTLLKLIEHLSARPTPRQLVGILESTGPMQRRVRMIARFNPNSSGGWMWGVTLLMILGCTALTDRVRADNPQNPAPRFAVRNIEAVADPKPAADSKPASDANGQALLAKRVPEVRFSAMSLTSCGIPPMPTSWSSGGPWKPPGSTDRRR